MSGSWPFDFTWRFRDHWSEARNGRAKAKVLALHALAWLVIVPTALSLATMMFAVPLFIGPALFLMLVEWIFT